MALYRYGEEGIRQWMGLDEEEEKKFKESLVGKEKVTGEVLRKREEEARSNRVMVERNGEIVIEKAKASPMSKRGRELS